MNSLNDVISIVPALPPAIDGLGDYALKLACQLRQDFNIQTHFIVGNPTWTGVVEEIEGFPISKVSDRSSDALLILLAGDRSTTVLLHYVGYGYANKGCPFWLVQGLERWKAKTNNLHFVTMFHEVYASGYPPWTSSFWLQPWQKQLAERLTKLSVHCITSKQSYAEILHKLSRKKQTQINHIPVFSNIGEPEYVPPLKERSLRLVVFGHRNSRLQVYQQCYTALEQICDTLKIEEICDIGVSTGLKLSAINGIPIVEKGVTEASAISQIMLDSVAGFLNFPPPAHLAKSTIFATLSAHRMIPCMFSSSTVPIDGLQRGKNYWSMDDQSNPLSLDMGQEIADNAYAWYQTHNLPSQAKIFARSLGLNPEAD
jgi:hypothetical protein